MRFVEPLLRGLDGLYLALQGALKVYGLVPDSSSAPEVQGEEEGREVVLRAGGGRWPELRLPLPPTASHWFAVDSVYRRGHVWWVAEPVEEIASFYRRALRGARGEVTEETADGRAAFTVSGDDLDVLVKIGRHPHGVTMLSISQKLGRLRLGPDGEVEPPRRPERSLSAGNGDEP